jgi:RNA polymerase sigma factor (sigma-70 family)
MLKVKAGELDQMGLLFERYNKPLFSFMYHSTHQSELSEDLVQNSFYRMIKYKHAFSGDGSFKTWMYYIARNVLNDHFKKKNLLVFDNDIELTGGHLEEEKQADVLFEKKENIEQLKLAISKLNEPSREIIVLSKYQELSYSDIAEILNISESNVKVRVHRAIGELKKLMIK